MAIIHATNPATGEKIKCYDLFSHDAVEAVLDNSARSRSEWASLSLDGRTVLLRSLANVLRTQKKNLAELITSEMGKLIGEAQSEIDKCAWVCDYYADKGQQFLADTPIESDASYSYIAYQPLGTILAIMPWNFPFWQVFRCAVPALMAGNNILLKHASNVPGCALALEQLFQTAGFPSHIFSSLLISSNQVEAIIADKRIHAVSLTGSEKAGRSVAATAGQYLKKTVLELGGSDAFVALEDADMDETVMAAIQSRFLNSGQSCIAAKRFIVLNSVADEFIERLHMAIEKRQVGDPLNPETTLAPMAREDLRDILHQQVSGSIDQGAVKVTGGKIPCRPGWFYAATLLDHVKPGMPAYDEEVFGPVAVVIRATDEQAALRIANDTRFGLGGSVWTKDAQKGENFARAMDCGCVYVNGMVKSDPRLPFGGIKHSGYGRELSLLGIREFMNAKTIWIK
ncbi:succinate-semialdehyde dehydrogenase / glutarate-semialdehyde dehydrogenase [Nitrosomonas cryotolerans]|uniref:Succinate-semialdehyde dehydrogenase / glutarate-semialdehyde dehydrogenase n=1 Tax=Nitrosomonas cryotolerans ATCC 49181 TaxID=1131553 RepID=A0A1N6IL40_9PROT|nr:NAD-dependent succinate-semialdehyde dehydrogenase [Nitrosomonas cryotolerans]SFP37419.1 succinate-semialdehyde dehydrogenase / glutarate-semialdehyde dehydrogenase [Nitrosomonas cryotolerans]SIO32696.1 succinate-semialdehyde dehydrogenase / glutarate-semialdehyde dehydrogenase [Nitrosomonas cryotolerans ATCC 49181]